MRNSISLDFTSDCKLRIPILFKASSTFSMYFFVLSSVTLFRFDPPNLFYWPYKRPAELLTL